MNQSENTIFIDHAPPEDNNFAIWLASRLQLFGFKVWLDQEKLPDLLTLKYQALSDAEEVLGSVDEIRTAFIGFQKHLYEKTVA